jgi:hypothetical protein
MVQDGVRPCWKQYGPSFESQCSQADAMKRARADPSALPAAGTRAPLRGSEATLLQVSRILYSLLYILYASKMHSMNQSVVSACAIVDVWQGPSSCKGPGGDRRAAEAGELGQEE